MSKSVMVRLPVYRTPDGRPTCVIDGLNQCPMWHSDEDGTVCGFSGWPIVGADMPPARDCPLWSHADRCPGLTHSGDNGVDCGCRS